MSITGELRSSVANYPFRDNRDFALFDTIADRIDAEHEKVTSRAGQLLADAEHDRNCYYLNWQDCKQKLLQRSITTDELYARIECLEDELSHCIELPKDAVGVPIRVGDVMEGEKIGGGFGEPFEVVGYIMSNGELEPMDKHKCPRKRKYSHHYHEPTVEDVLREFGDWYAHTKGGCDEDGIVAEYAAKLRLAGEKEQQ